jgi:hypothetical protein
LRQSTDEASATAPIGVLVVGIVRAVAMTDEDLVPREALGEADLVAECHVGGGGRGCGPRRGRGRHGDARRWRRGVWRSATSERENEGSKGKEAFAHRGAALYVHVSESVDKRRARPPTSPVGNQEQVRAAPLAHLARKGHGAAGGAQGPPGLVRESAARLAGQVREGSGILPRALLFQVGRVAVEPPPGA